MRKAVAFLKQFQFGKFLTVLLMGVVLMVTTACNNGDNLGARPDNLPVQMGGGNNPHKAGGDGYTEYKSAPDAKINSGKQRASLIQAPSQWVAINDPHERYDDPNYPPASRIAAPERNRNVDSLVSPNMQKELMDPTQIPAPRQPVIDRSDPNARILEKTGQAFKQASKVLTGPAEDTHERSELEQVTPIRGEINRN